MVLADVTVLCFLYDDFSATDLGTKVITKVPQREGVWLRTQTSHTLFQATCRTFAYLQFQATAHIERVVCTTPCTSLSAEQTAAIFRTSNATKSCPRRFVSGCYPRNMGPCEASLKQVAKGHWLPPVIYRPTNASHYHSLIQSINQASKQASNQTLCSRKSGTKWTNKLGVTTQKTLQMVR
jgi:hypothetical protein